ncbi:SMP-30/gluconolactonase/LRE family protein [Paramicrobacterium chengjingii]|uniref:SMP-30/gluconolactonase/LRE family protein n=1 Tax=Paramicrobacterium chengjingii TaxID=2769067 RepID=UPI00141DA338|nr:SMP-30/gluconolactonase/LRE family protein [Microbacterium chengjingii]
MKEYIPQLAGPVAAELGEGPIWDAATERLIWIDIIGQTVHFADAAGRTYATVTLDEQPGTAMPAADGTVLVATATGFALIERDLSVRRLSEDLAGYPDHRFNDGKVDSAGRVVVGTLSLSGERDASALYRWSAQGGLEVIRRPVSLSNGLGWSPDGRTFYHADTPTGRVDAFDYDPGSGALSNPRTFITVAAEAGQPDGLCVDDDGGVWVALWGGGMVLRFDQDGQLDARVPFDVPNITSCGFGGTDRRTLFVTTASVDMDDELLLRNPEAGGLFRVNVGRSGPAAEPWEVPRAYLA